MSFPVSSRRSPVHYNVNLHPPFESLGVLLMKTRWLGNIFDGLFLCSCFLRDLSICGDVVVVRKGNLSAGRKF